MKKFSKHYSWNGNESLISAAHIIHELKGLNNLDIKNWFEYDQIDWINKCFKPSRRTILHEYINFIYSFQYEYLLDKHFPMELINTLSDLMDRYDIDYSHLGKADFIGLNDDEIFSEELNFEDIEKYGYSLLKFFHQELETIFTDDIFTILFANKEFLFEFNSQLQDLVLELKLQDNLLYLKKDGVFKRADYIPSWLKKGVFMRDKGRCQICGTDLTKILTLEDSENFDHIIPLELGGTNDPINFQLTCEHCNKSKRDRHSTYNSLGARYWEIK